MEESFMSETKKVFSKEKWLAAAMAQLSRGELTQREIDDACEIWVDKIDGKTAEEIAEMTGDRTSIREDWFVEA